jgi:acetylornithine/succinyldiaminopimelate/putrescine aminotransferase
MAAGLRFLDTQTAAELRASLGRPVESLPSFEPLTKGALPDSYGGNATGPSADFLVGRGLFYIDEQRRLFLDCTAGHYQMLWGYGHPELQALIEESSRAGVVWDNHSNIPQAPVKRLGQELIAAANAPGDPDPLDKVLLGVCTGSVACGAALKIQLKVHAAKHGTRVTPVIIVLAGNYHGSDLAAQFMRGLWPHLTRPFECVELPPNDRDALDAAFGRHRERIAGFWAEPVMMNREAIPIEAAYLEAARRHCDAVGALLCIDEIQTGFWRPEIFDYRALGLRPDLVVLGKGMAAGFHPLSGVLFRRRHDVLEQYDAISTNGSAALPALVALGSIGLIRRESARIAETASGLAGMFAAVAAEFPHLAERAQGRGHLWGLRLRTVTAARALHRRLLTAGYWTRVHAYHEGHRTLLTKLGLLTDTATVDCLGAALRRELTALSASES